MSYQKWAVRSMGVLIVSFLVVFGALRLAAAGSNGGADALAVAPPEQLSSANTAVKSLPDVSPVDTAANSLAVEASSWYYSPWISEENPPFTCQNQYLIDFMQCSGSYCDSVAVRCNDIYRNYASSSWSSYFSEEGTYYRYCSGSSFMTGISCKGSYCDSLSIQCTYLAGTAKGNCYWTTWFSEEYPSWRFLDPGYFAAGLACSGRYCDNKSIYACQAL